MSATGDRRKRRHLVLLSGPIFSSNMGCNALTCGALAILEDVARRLDLEFAYSLLDNPVNGAIPPELAVRDVELVDQVPDFGAKSLLRTLVRREWAKVRRRHHALRSADLFLDDGWGTVSATSTDEPVSNRSSAITAMRDRATSR